MRLLSALLATTLTTSALAANLTVVGRYAEAQAPEVWRNVRGDEVPASLIESKSVADPSNPYSQLFPRAFYQEDNFLVCYRDCSERDARGGKEQLEQQNVYYWLTRFYAMARERFDLAPSGRVKVMTDRRVADPGSSKVMRNNAFFNPADGTLSFLPASSNPLAALLGADKLNRSGFDPSVVAHEAGHSLFHALFPNAVNQEISGFNEGFADYMANILLNKSELGLVMLRGKVLRDSNSLVDSAGEPKTYQAGQEVHDMGERFAAALWKSRAVVSDKDGFDRLVIDAVEDIAKNPFATGHGFKEALLARVDHMLGAEEARAVRAHWEFFLEGRDRRVSDTSFLRSGQPATSAWGLRTETRFPESVTRELGLTNEVSRFLYIKDQPTRDGFTAFMVATQDDSVVTPYWILIDTARSNTLGAWRLDGSAVEEGDLKAVTALARQIGGLRATLEDFRNRARMFSDLKSGRGELRIAYKVDRLSNSSATTVFNGQAVRTVTTHMKLKRRLLAAVLGIPKLRGVALTTVPAGLMSPEWPTLDGQPIIGITMELEDGTVSSSTFEQLRL